MNPTQIKNPFKINDWDIKSFLIIVLSIKLAYLGSVGLDKLDIQLPLLRQVLGFIYLTFIPGYLLLRIFRIHRLSSAESFLYAIGLSLFFSMFIGFIMNMLYPLLGITDKPISEVPIITTFTLATFLLAILAYFRDKDYSKPDFIDLKNILNPQVLFLTLIPFMAIFGTYLVNYHDNNILLMAMIIVIVLVCLIVGFTNWINEKYYSYAIWVIAISLLFYMSLITSYAINHDGEMVGARIIIKEGYWNLHLHGNYNSIIVSNIFTPMIYFICNISLTWIYKIIFPIFTSIIPIVIYLISIKYLNPKKSFFSALIFIISGWAVYVSIFIRITKQAIATLFFSLMINVLIDKKLLFNKSVLLSIIFGLGIIFSHYGTTYLVLFGLMFTTTIFYFISRNRRNINEFRKISTITFLYVLLAVLWYIYVSGASVVETLLTIGIKVFNFMWYEFLSPHLSRGAYLLVKHETGLLVVLKYINLSVIVLITLGIILEILKCIKLKYKRLENEKLLINNKILLFLSLYFIWLLVLSVILPYFAVMSPGRLYLLGLCTLSLFCVIGITNLLHITYNNILKLRLKIIIKNSKNNNINIDIERSIQRFLSIYLSTLILFNTGFIGEVTHNPYLTTLSIALSKNSINTFGTPEDKAKFYARYIMDYDISSIKWLSSNCKEDAKVFYTAGFTSILFVPYNYGNFLLKYENLNKNSHSLPNGSYVWLLYANIKENIGFSTLAGVHWFDWYEFNKSNIYQFIISSTNKIYDNNGSQVLWVY